MKDEHIEQERMKNYLQNTLSQQEKNDIETHIALCPECAARLDEEKNHVVEAQPAPETAAKPEEDKPVNWNHRIRASVLIQVGAVVLVAAILLVMILVPSKRVRDAQAPAGLSVEKQTAEVPASVSEVKAEPEQTETKAETQPMPAVPAKVPGQVVLEQNEGLVKIFKVCSIRPNTGKTSLIQIAESPFSKNTYVIYADCPDTMDISIHPADDTTCISDLRFSPHAQSVVIRMNQDGVTPVALIRFEQKGTGKTQIMPVASVMIRDFKSSSPVLQLVSILHAACDPKILLAQKVLREEMIRVLEDLLKNEYAASADVREFTEKLKQVR